MADLSPPYISALHHATYSLRPRILGAIQKLQRPRKTLITARCQKKRSVPPRNNFTLRILRNAPLTEHAPHSPSPVHACTMQPLARVFPRARVPSRFHARFFLPIFTPACRSKSHPRYFFGFQLFPLIFQIHLRPRYLFSCWRLTSLVFRHASGATNGSFVFL